MFHELGIADKHGIWYIALGLDHREISPGIRPREIPNQVTPCRILYLPPTCMVSYDIICASGIDHRAAQNARWFSPTRRSDTSPSSHGTTFRLTPAATVLSPAASSPPCPNSKPANSVAAAKYSKNPWSWGKTAVSH